MTLGLSPRLAVALSLTLLVSSGIATGAARAQDRTIDSVIVDQNRIIQTYRAPLERQGSLAIGIDVAEDMTDAPDAAETLFTLQAVEVVGGENGPIAALPALWEPYLGTEVSLAGMGDITAAIDAAYLADDLYAHAILQSVDLVEGRAVIVIFEGFLEEIVIEGADAALRERLQPYVDRIAAIVPLRPSALERNLLLMADLGGYAVEALLQRLPLGRGAGRLTLTFTRDDLSGTAVLNNMASSETGPLQLTGIAMAGDLLGAFEQSSLVGVVNPTDPSEFRYLSLSQSYPIGTHGLRAGYVLGGFHVRPGGDLADQGIRIETGMATASVEFPLVRRIARNLIGTLQFDAQNNTVDVGPATVVQDHNRWLTLAFDHDRTFSWGTVLGRVGAIHGIGGLGSTSGNRPEAGRFGGVPDFRMLTGELHVAADLAESLAARLDFSGQHAIDPLPNAARFSVGNGDYGRAFTDSSIDGDSGYGVSGELERSFDAGIDGMVFSSVFGFVDYGHVRNDPIGTAYESARLGSAGAGLRVALANGLFAEAYAAVPVWQSSVVEDRGTRYRFTLAVSF